MKTLKDPNTQIPKAAQYSPTWVLGYLGVWVLPGDSP